MSVVVRRLVALLIALTGLATAADAHQMNLSSARIERHPDRSVEVEVALKGSDVDRLLGTAIYDERRGQVLTGALGPAATAIAGYVVEHATVRGADGRSCAHGEPRLRLDGDGDGVAVTVAWNCAAVPGALLYRSTVLTSLDPSARQVVLIRDGETESQALLDASDTDVTLAADAPPTAMHVIGRYLAAGVEHIFLGYDHIAFLVAVVLWARRLGPVIKIVTSFTVAHSVTLSLAALKIVEIPAAIIEPDIAASIVFVAVENFVSRDVDRRWRVTFLFGFIHGFGFADALQAFGLPRGALVTALASFNVGVELGQIAIVSIVVPLLLQVDRMADRRADARPASVVYALSSLITALGCYWFLARTVLA